MKFHPLLDGELVRSALGPSVSASNLRFSNASIQELLRNSDAMLYKLRRVDRIVALDQDALLASRERAAVAAREALAPVSSDCVDAFIGT